MKKLLLSLVVVLAALSPAVASRTAAMNISDPTATISARGVQAIYDVAKNEPGFKIRVDQAYGAPLESTELEVVNSFVIKKGKTYPNSGLDSSRMPLDHPTLAKGDTIFFAVRSKQTGKIVTFKDLCLNVCMLTSPEIPSTSRVCDTTWNINEVDIRLQLSQAQNNNQHLTASASTGPISIVFNNITQAAPLMVGGGNSSNQFFATRDSRGLMSLGYTIGGTMKIFNSNIANGGAGGIGNGGQGGQGGAGGAGGAGGDGGSASAAASASASASAAAAGGGK